MPTLAQASKDLALADRYVDLLEQQLGKKTSHSLRRMLRDAVMAGIKHGRQGASNSSTGNSTEQLVRDLLTKYRTGV